MFEIRSRLRGKGRWLWPAITAVALAIAAMSIVAAQTGGGHGRGHDRDGHRGIDDAECAEVAELVGAADCDALKSAVDDGQTLAEIAESNDIEPQTVIDAIVADMTAELDDKVDDGDITEERATTLRERLTETVTEFVNEGFNDKREHRGKRGHDRDGFHGFDAGDCDELAELVGAADCAALKSAIEDGQTLAEIAESNDIEAQTVIDALVAEMNTEIDAKVAAGDITEERAATFRERITEKITEFVNEGFNGDRGHRRGGHRW